MSSRWGGRITSVSTTRFFTGGARDRPTTGGTRDQGDVWFIKKPHVNDLHPTMKPVELVERATRNSSKSRDTVFDPFGGSGTTLIACEKSGRPARLIELDPRYCDTVIRRRQSFAGAKAEHETSGRTFDNSPQST